MTMTIAELKAKLASYPEEYYCHPDMLKGYVYLPEPETTLDKHKVNAILTDPYSARVMILKLEEEYNLTIRIYDTSHCCQIFIDKEKIKHV